jgi:photoactive yellow protein
LRDIVKTALKSNGGAPTTHEQVRNASGAPAMSTTHITSFADTDLFDVLQGCSDTELDALDFGVIGFDGEGIVRRYNAFESQVAGLSPERVVGHPLFTVVAPCMNNFMVAQRFDDAKEDGVSLDVTLDYVLTLRMRPVKVRLRLLSGVDSAMAYVLVQRAL